MEEEILFENEYTTKEEDIKKFLGYVSLKHRITALMVGIITLITGYLEYSSGNKFIGVFLLLIGIFGTGMFFGLLPMMLKDIKKQNLIGTTQLCQFYPEEINITVENNKNRLKYTGIREVVNRDEEFYLMVSKEGGIIIKKKAFKEGTSEEFEKFINRRVKKDTETITLGG